MLRFVCLAVSTTSVAIASSNTIDPTLDPAGAVTIITLFGADADPGSTGWNQIPDSRAMRTTGPGRPLSYHIIIPDDPLSWRLGVTARSRSANAPKTRFNLSVNDQPFTPLLASPRADDYSTHWTPLGPFSGLVNLTITPEGDAEGWQGVDIGAIQLARRGPDETFAPAGSPDRTLTRSAQPLRSGKSSGGGGGGGGGSSTPPIEFPPPIDPPDPEPPLEELIQDPTPPTPRPPRPPSDPPTRGTGGEGGGVPSPAVWPLGLAALAFRRRR